MSVNVKVLCIFAPLYLIAVLAGNAFHFEIFFSEMDIERVSCFTN